MLLMLMLSGVIARMQGRRTLRHRWLLLLLLILLILRGLTIQRLLLLLVRLLLWRW